jgi:hypothetical protein
MFTAIRRAELVRAFEGRSRYGRSALLPPRKPCKARITAGLAPQKKYQASV